MKLDLKKETFEKLKEVYEAQYGHMPQILSPSWYVLKIPAYSNVEKEVKVEFLLKILIDQGLERKSYDILDSGDLLVCTHYGRIESLVDRFGSFEVTPLTGIDYMPVKADMA